jgi:tetratricopeptide (TPR) repeat protein
LKVFVSHRRDDGATFAKLSAELQAAGIEALDAAGAETGTGASPLEVLLEQSDATLFLLAPGAESDPWVQREWRDSLDESWDNPDRPMIPLLIGDATPPPFLRDRQAIQITGDADLKRAADEVAAILRGERTTELADAPRAEEERKRRFLEIAQQAVTLAPSPQDLEHHAEFLEQREAALSSKSPVDPSLADMRIEHADVLKGLDRFDEALAQMQAAAEILLKDPQQKRRLARVYTNMATLLERLGRYEEARLKWVAARDIYLDLDGNLSLNALVARTNLITVLNRLGQPQAAAAEQAALRGDAASVANTALRVLGEIGKQAFGRVRALWRGE